jgi:predicted transcriptional regulator
LRVLCRFLRVLYKKFFACIMKKSINKGNSEEIVKSVKNALGDDTLVTIYNGRKFPKDIPPFVMLFQAVNVTLSKELSPSSCKVLLYLISLMQYSNHIGCDQQTVAEELNLSLRSVNGAVGELKTRKIIIEYKDPQDKRRNVYLINPLQSWKGSFKERIKVMKENKEQLQLDFKEEQKPKQISIKPNQDFE